MKRAMFFLLFAALGAGEICLAQTETAFARGDAE